MTSGQTLPDLWLISDARNDAALEQALRLMPPGSGFVFRHYHLAPDECRERYADLTRIARAQGHLVALSGTPGLARRWRADAVYGPSARIAGAHDLIRIATVHSLRELGAAHRARADMVMLAPVFATRSHPDAATLGPVRARLIARHARVPVVMLGGMDAARARRLAPNGWAAIDGLTAPAIPTGSDDLD